MGPHKHKKPYTASKGRKVSNISSIRRKYAYTYVVSSSVPVVAASLVVSRCKQPYENRRGVLAGYPSQGGYLCVMGRMHLFFLASNVFVYAFHNTLMNTPSGD